MDLCANTLEWEVMWGGGRGRWRWRQRVPSFPQGRGDPGQSLVASIHACGVTVGVRWVVSALLVRGWVCGCTLPDLAFHTSSLQSHLSHSVAKSPESHFLSDS